MKKSIFWVMIMISGLLMVAQTEKTVQKVSVPKPDVHKLPLNIFLKLIDSTDAFVINHATQFEHIDLPQKMYDMFTGYIKDSAAAEVPGLKSLVYYNYTLKSGTIIIGDIYWNDQKSYIVFKADNRKYVNYFTRDGVQQLKSLFKL